MKSDCSIPVRGIAMKKVTRRSSAIADCSTSDTAECAIEASLPEIAQQTSCTLLDGPHQNVHQPLLVLGAVHQSDSEGLLSETVLPIACRGTRDYCDWWRDQVLRQDNLGLFNARLVGDASSPELFTPMALVDLAYCRYASCTSVCVIFSSCYNVNVEYKLCVRSKWGHNRVLEHQGTTSPINLVLPVLTRPDVVQQAVAGMLSGQIGLTMSNVEAFLVVANAVGVSHMAYVLHLRNIMRVYGGCTSDCVF